MRQKRRGKMEMRRTVGRRKEKELEGVNPTKLEEKEEEQKEKRKVVA